jgi:hypothetical protein
VRPELLCAEPPVVRASFFFLQQFLIHLRNSIVDELDEPRFLLGMSRVQT